MNWVKIDKCNAREGRFKVKSKSGLVDICEIRKPFGELFFQSVYNLFRFNTNKDRVLHPVYSFEFHGVVKNTKVIETICLSLSQSPAAKCIVLTSYSENDFRNAGTWNGFVGMLKYYESLGVAEIVYTNGKPKVDFIKKLKITAHFDFNEAEIDSINNVYPGIGILLA